MTIIIHFCPLNPPKSCSPKPLKAPKQLIDLSWDCFVVLPVVSYFLLTAKEDTVLVGSMVKCALVGELLHQQLVSQIKL